MKEQKPNKEEDFLVNVCPIDPDKLEECQACQ